MPPRRRMARRTARRTTHRTMRRHRRRRRRRVMVAGAVLVTAGAAAYGAYKLSQPDVEKIEQKTGVPVEELDDAELEKTMKELNIQPQEMTDEDKAALAASSEEGTTDKEAEATQPAAKPVTQSDDYFAELEKLADLHERGILTDEEFEAKKKEVLGLD